MCIISNLRVSRALTWGHSAQHAGYHPYLGCVVLALAVLQPLLAAMRPPVHDPRYSLFLHGAPPMLRSSGHRNLFSSGGTLHFVKFSDKFYLLAGFKVDFRCLIPRQKRVLWGIHCSSVPFKDPFVSLFWQEAPV